MKLNFYLQLYLLLYTPNMICLMYYQLNMELKLTTLSKYMYHKITKMF